MTSAIDSSFIGTGPVSKASMRTQLDTAASEITALQTAVSRAAVAANILDYGGINNGTGDNAAAVTAAIAAGKRSIFFPQGTYQFTTGVTINSPVCLFGEGHNTIIKPSGTIMCFTFGGGHLGSMVSDMYLNGSVQSGAGGVFLVNDASRITFERLYGFPRNPLKIIKCTNAFINDWWMSDVRGSYVIWYYGDNANRSDNLNLKNVIVGCNTTDKPVGLDWDGHTYSVVASNVQFVTPSIGLRIRNSSGGANTPAIGRLFSFCVDFPDQDGIDIQVATTDVDFIAPYVGISTTGSGFKIAAAVGANQLRIIGGKSISNARYGVESLGTSAQIITDLDKTGNALGEIIGASSAFAAQTLSKRFTLDANGYYDINATGEPILNWDANDYNNYNRATNTYGWAIGGVSKLQLDANRLNVAAGLVQITPVAKASLPSAVTYPSALAMITDGTANRSLVYSDGIIWRYIDGNIV